MAFSERAKKLARSVDDLSAGGGNCFGFGFFLSCRSQQQRTHSGDLRAQLIIFQKKVVVKERGNCRGDGKSSFGVRRFVVGSVVGREAGGS
jgi:hypothetical protein